jgi:superfamily II DNA or RNA helicase
MAALDHRALREAGRVDTLLYTAHRREILDQARSMFRNALQQPGFGELLYHGERPAIGRHVFASIDSLGPSAAIDPAAFDHVVVDEAHHSPAVTWEPLLTVVNPKEQVGLTTTPERADGLDYERHFPRPWVGNLRVWNAIPTRSFHSATTCSTSAAPISAMVRGWRDVTRPNNSRPRL